MAECAVNIVTFRHNTTEASTYSVITGHSLLICKCIYLYGQHSIPCSFASIVGASFAKRKQWPVSVHKTTNHFVSLAKTWSEMWQKKDNVSWKLKRLDSGKLSANNSYHAKRRCAFFPSLPPPAKSIKCCNVNDDNGTKANLITSNASHVNVFFFLLSIHCLSRFCQCHNSALFHTECLRTHKKKNQTNLNIKEKTRNWLKQPIAIAAPICIFFLDSSTIQCIEALNEAVYISFLFNR